MYNAGLDRPVRRGKTRRTSTDFTESDTVLSHPGRPKLTSQISFPDPPELTSQMSFPSQPELTSQMSFPPQLELRSQVSFPAPPELMEKMRSASRVRMRSPRRENKVSQLSSPRRHSSATRRSSSAALFSAAFGCNESRKKTKKITTKSRRRPRFSSTLKRGMLGPNRLPSYPNFCH